MAKITIDIDGKDASVKIDGKDVANLASFGVTFWKDVCGCDGRVNNEIYFGYTVKNDGEGEFPSSTRYKYNPATASFDAGKNVVNLKSPTSNDYKGM